MRIVVLALLALLGLAACGDDADEPAQGGTAGGTPYPVAGRGPHPRGAGGRGGSGGYGGKGGTGGMGGMGGMGGTGGSSPNPPPTPPGNPCKANPCSHGSCEETGDTTYTCKCDKGWMGKTCSTNKDDCADSPCKNGLCTDKVDGYACQCSAGWTGTNCEKQVNHCDKNECTNAGTCVNEATGYACNCPHGFSGAHCETKVATCSDDPCAHGVCADYGQGYECSCQPGWSGEHCTVNVDDCAGVTQCGAYGACVDGLGGYTCKCQAGWTGPLCDQNIDDCATNPCQNAGTCVDGVNAYSCKCDEKNWTGQNCTVNIDNCNGNTACGDHGTCKDKDDGFECQCAGSWYGDKCTQKMDYCSSNACQNGSTCVVQADSYTCTCPSGWEGSHCEQKIDPCSRCGAGQVCKANSCVTGVVVPNVVGLEMDPAGDAVVHAKLQMPVMPDFTDVNGPLGDHGFILVQDAHNPKVRVLEQNPAPGTLVAEGTPVALKVAIPPDDKRFLKDPLSSNNDTNHTADVYYTTIDPDKSKDTLSKWIDQNGFNDPSADTAQVIYQNTVDLGFVRDMHMAKLNGRIAFYVKNHKAFGDFRSNKAPLATVAMEYGRAAADPAGKPFVTFYTFDTAGNRLLEIDLDGGGPKSQPGLCLTCHGGFTGSDLPKSADRSYPKNGDTGARFIPFDLSLLAYENNAALGSTRAAQEDAFRKMNLAVKESYAGDDLHAAELIDGWYTPGPTFNENFVPPGWTSELELYTRVIKPNCRLCHSQQNRVSDFRNSDNFLPFKDLVRTHVFERATMPLARRTFYDFWVSYPNAPSILARKIGGHPQDNNPVTGYLVAEFPQSTTMLVDPAVLAPIPISPKVAFVDSIEYALSKGDPSLYRLVPVGTTDLAFDLVSAPNSSELVTISYTAHGSGGGTKTGSFDVAVTIPTPNVKLSFFGDKIDASWKALPCSGCHRQGSIAEHAYVVDQPDATITSCLNDPSLTICSQTFVSRITKGDGASSKLIRVPYDGLPVPFNGVQTNHPYTVTAGTVDDTTLQQLQKWIDDGAAP